MLPSDQLGAKGENRFAEWCEDVSLTCNKVQRDRAGWDFVVDFPLPVTKQTFDHRPPALVCLVQVKTILSTTTSIDVRLDMAERLAKDVRPSFLVVPIVNPSLEFDSVHVLHIAGRHLERILKRLRKASKNNEALSEKTISFTVGMTPALAPAGASIELALRGACRQGMRAYGRSKELELQQAGFKPGAYRAEMTFAPADAETVLDALLGLRAELPFENFRVTETRFNITVEEDAIGKGVASFSPAPMGEGSLRLLSDTMARPLFQRVQYFTVPFAVGRTRKMLFSGPDITLAISHTAGDARIGASLRFVDIDNGLPLHAWHRRAAWALAITSGAFVFEIEVAGRPELHLPKTVAGQDAVAIGGARALLGLMEVLVDLASRAGLDPALHLSLFDIEVASRFSSTIKGLVAGEPYRFTAEQAPETFQPFPILLSGVVLLGRIKVAWCGTIDVNPPNHEGQDMWMSGFALTAARSVRNLDEFDEFLKRESARNGHLQSEVLGEVPLEFFRADADEAQDCDSSAADKV